MTTIREQTLTAPSDHAGDPDYGPLRSVLDMALNQAAFQKGAERHANGKPFTDQPMMEIGRMAGLGFPVGQAMKKGQEAIGMVARGQRDAAERELLGAINYLAGAVLLIREQNAEKSPVDGLSRPMAISPYPPAETASGDAPAANWGTCLCEACSAYRDRHAARDSFPQDHTEEGSS